MSSECVTYFSEGGTFERFGLKTPLGELDDDEVVESRLQLLE